MNMRNLTILIMAVFAAGTSLVIKSSAYGAEGTDEARATAVVASLEAAAAADPKNPAAQVELSQAYATVGRAQDAFLAIQKAVELSPDNLAYHTARIPLANWAGKTAAAAESAEKILKENPNDRTARLALARIRKWQGRLSDSSREYKRYIDQFADDKAAVIEYAQVEAWQGDMSHALSLLDLYVKRYGMDDIEKRERGRVLASANRPHAAQEAILGQKVVKVDTFEQVFTVALAQFYAHEHKNAQGALEQLDKLRPGNPEARGLRDFIEAPRRTQVRAFGNYYGDSDHLQIIRAGAVAELSVAPDTRLEVLVENVMMDANLNSGLEGIDGAGSKHVFKYQAGVEQYIAPSLSVAGRAGWVELQHDNNFAGSAGLNWRPMDCLTLKAAAGRDVVLISPRAVSMNIETRNALLEMQWEPDLDYTVVAFGRIDDYTDGNQRVEAALAPRRSVLRSQYLNVDMGVRGWWLQFQDRLNNGYYAPEAYEQYSGTMFAYTKLGPQSGIGLIGAAGYYADETMNHYSFGWSVDAELTVGAFADWMLKINGAVVQNLRSYAAGAFDAHAAGISLTRRF